MRSVSAWILTDGKAGDEQPCIGLAEAMGLDYSLRRVRPGLIASFFMPRGPVGWREHPSRKSSPIYPPFPQIVIATGRRSVPYLRSIYQRAHGKCFTVFLKDPRCKRDFADFFWANTHDDLEDANVMTSLTGPHRFSQKRLAQARMAMRQDIALLARPRIAVLVGGNSRHYRYGRKECSQFCHALEALIENGSGLMITLSRRTPAPLAREIRKIANKPGHLIWDGNNPNPLLDFIAHADHIVATADSTNMVGEALAAGCPVHLFEPKGGHRKITAYIDALRQAGLVEDFLKFPLIDARRPPFDATPEIAAAVWRSFREHQIKHGYQQDS